MTSGGDRPGDEPVSFCVVGGGISGLAAAHRLRVAVGAAARITLLDPADRLGGVLRTEVVGGVRVDVGAEAFVARRPEVVDLLRELGLAGLRRVCTGARPLLYSQGSLHPVPPGTLYGIPASAESVRGLVDCATVARISAEPRFPLHWRPGGDPVLGEVIAARFGQQVVTRSVDPLIAGVYSGSATAIGIRSAVPTLAQALDAGACSLTAAVRSALPAPTGAPVFGAIIGGYAELIEALATRAAARWVKAAAVGLERDRNRWAVQDTDGAVHRADRIILAVPPTALAAVLGVVAPRSAAAAARIPCASSVVVTLALKGSAGTTRLPDNSGVLVVAGEELSAKAITLSSRKWGLRGADGEELLRLSFGRFDDPNVERMLRVDDAELVNRAVADLRTVFGVDVDVVDRYVQRWPDAMPQYRPGHGDVVAELRAGLPPGIAVTGNFLDGIGVPSCITASRAAVAAVLD